MELVLTCTCIICSCVCNVDASLP